MDVSKEMTLLVKFKKLNDGTVHGAISRLVDALLYHSDCPNCPGWTGRWRAGIDDIDYMIENEAADSFVGHGVAWSLGGHPVEFDLPVRMELAFDLQTGELADGWIEIGAPYRGAGTLQNFSREKICEALRVQACGEKSKLQIIWQYCFSYEGREWSMSAL